jgi:protein phosphatase
VHPRWLVYLPPTMAPVGGLPERPAEAFDHYARAGVAEVVVQAKHMGSRAVVLVCRSAEAAARRFGAAEGPAGTVLSRTGRRMLPAADTARLVDEVRAAATAAGLWDELDTDWLALDAELLPWSAAGAGLLTGQYEPVAAAGLADGRAVAAVLAAAAGRGLPVAAELATARDRLADAAAFDTAWRRYAGLDEPVRLAPFCLLAGAGEVYARCPVGWQLELLDRLVAAADGPRPALVSTARQLVRLDDEGSREQGSAWWQALVDAGGEGTVVKPAGGWVHGPQGLVQPGLKVRGDDYLRLVYGPHYREPGNSDRLARRNVARKRSLALREYALGLEALDRFVAGEPLWRVHEAVAAVLALESDPVDPRL